MFIEAKSFDKILSLGKIFFSVVLWDKMFEKILPKI